MAAAAEAAKADRGRRFTATAPAIRGENFFSLLQVGVRSKYVGWQESEDKGSEWISSRGCGDAGWRYPTPSLAYSSSCRTSSNHRCNRDSGCGESSKDKFSSSKARTGGESDVWPIVNTGICGGRSSSSAWSIFNEKTASRKGGSKKWSSLDAAGREKGNISGLSAASPDSSSSRSRISAATLSHSVVETWRGSSGSSDDIVTQQRCSNSNSAPTAASLLPKSYSLAAVVGLGVRTASAEVKHLQQSTVTEAPVTIYTTTLSKKQVSPEAGQIFRRPARRGSAGVAPAEVRANTGRAASAGGPVSARGAASGVLASPAEDRWRRHPTDTVVRRHTQQLLVDGRGKKIGDLHNLSTCSSFGGGACCIADFSREGLWRVATPPARAVATTARAAATAAADESRCWRRGALAAGTDEERRTITRGRMKEFITKNLNDKIGSLGRDFTSVAGYVNDRSECSRGATLVATKTSAEGRTRKVVRLSAGACNHYHAAPAAPSRAAGRDAVSAAGETAATAGAAATKAPSTSISGETAATTRIPRNADSGGSPLSTGAQGKCGEVLHAARESGATLLPEGSDTGLQQQSEYEREEEVQENNREYKNAGGIPRPRRGRGCFSAREAAAVHALVSCCQRIEAAILLISLTQEQQHEGKATAQGQRGEVNQDAKANQQLQRGMAGAAATGECDVALSDGALERGSEATTDTAVPDHRIEGEATLMPAATVEMPLKGGRRCVAVRRREGAIVAAALLTEEDAIAILGELATGLWTLQRGARDPACRCKLGRGGQRQDGHEQEQTKVEQMKEKKHQQAQGQLYSLSRMGARAAAGAMVAAGEDVAATTEDCVGEGPAAGVPGAAPTQASSAGLSTASRAIAGPVVAAAEIGKEAAALASSALKKGMTAAVDTGIEASSSEPRSERATARDVRMTAPTPSTLAAGEATPAVATDASSRARRAAADAFASHVDCSQEESETEKCAASSKDCVLTREQLRQVFRIMYLVDAASEHLERMKKSAYSSADVTACSQFCDAVLETAAYLECRNDSETTGRSNNSSSNSSNRKDSSRETDSTGPLPERTLASAPAAAIEGALPSADIATEKAADTPSKRNERRQQQDDRLQRHEARQLQQQPTRTPRGPAQPNQEQQGATRPAGVEYLLKLCLRDCIALPRSAIRLLTAVLHVGVTDEASQKNHYVYLYDVHACRLSHRKLCLYVDLLHTLTVRRLLVVLMLRVSVQLRYCCWGNVEAVKNNAAAGDENFEKNTVDNFALILGAADFADPAVSVPLWPCEAVDEIGVAVRIRNFRLQSLPDDCAVNRLVNPPVTVSTRVLVFM